MSPTAASIQDVGARWAEAEVAGDVSTLDALATDDFRLVGPFGFVLDKEQWLDRYRSGDFVTTSMTWHDVETRDYGDTAVAIGTLSQRAAYQDTPADGDFRIGHVFVRRGGEWAIANIHISLAAPPGPPPAGTADAS
jgi:ketosteroid isomerase-like protein